MKLCSYEQDGRRSFGLVNGDGVLDLKAALANAGLATLEDLIEAVAVGSLSLDAVGAALVSAPAISADEVTWRPPLARPGKILGVAINNRLGQDLAFRPFANPAFFFKPSSSLVGHGQPVVVRADYGLAHPEPELAVIIGRRAKSIALEDVRHHIFGYSIMNDVTSPGLKERDSLELVLPERATGGYSDLLGWRRVRDAEHQRSVYLTYHALSKGSDTFGPMGPWIVTADEIEDPNRLAINSYSGDDLVFEDSTANLTFSVEQIVAHASEYMTLEPGDIIHCGTAMRPAPGGRFLMLTQWDLRTSSATMAVEIEGVGRLENPIRLETDHTSSEVASN